MTDPASTAVPETSTASYGRSSLTATWDVFCHEFRDSIRSRQAIVLLIFYLIASVAATMLFAKMLASTKHMITSETHGLLSADAVLQNAKALRTLVSHFTKNQSLIDALVSLPAVVLFFGFFSMLLLPWLIVFSASPRVAEERSSGSARFVAIRISRLSWVCGKFLGQTLQFLLAIVLSGIAVWITGLERLPPSSIAGSMVPMILIGLKVWVYGLAFLGISLGISQLIASPTLATRFGFIAVACMALINLIGNTASSYAIIQCLGVLAWFVPNHYGNDLWANDLAQLSRTLGILIVMALVFFFAGYSLLRRKDL